MPSGDERVNLVLKRFLSQNRMSENFMKYLDGVLTDGLSRIFPASGLFTYPATFAFPAANKFSLGPDPIEGIDDQGHVLILEGTDLLNISFEDDGSSNYWVGMKYIQIPNGVYANPRTGAPEYDKLFDTVGEVGYASDITDLGGGQIEIELDFILPAGVDHSGRSVRAYLENPLSGESGVAFENLDVTYSGSHNIVTTNGPFGQGAVSPNPAYYRVACIGATVRKSAANPFGTEYIILGDVLSTGGIPTADDGSQRDLSGGGGHTLQKAYDGLSGLGSGYNVTVENRAVRFVQENDTLLEKDIAQAAFRIDKATDKGPIITGSTDPKDIETGIDLKSRVRSGGMIACRANLYDLSGSGFIQSEEDDVQVTVNGDILTFNRVGVDLQNTGNDGKLLLGIDMCEIEGSIQGNDGLYYVNGIAAGSLTLLGLDSVAASLIQEVGNANLRASFWRPTARIGTGYLESHQFVGLHEWLGDAGQSEIPFRILVAPNAEASYPSQSMQRWEIMGGDGLSINNNLDIVHSGVDPVILSPKARSEQFEVTGAGSIIHIGTGEIVHTGSGNISHQGAGDIRVTGTGNFSVDGYSDYIYDPARTIYRPIPIERMISRFNSPGNVPDWNISRFSGDIIYAFALIVASEMYLPFEIPEGCTLTDVEAIVRDTATGTISMFLFDASFNWTAGSVGSVGNNGSDSSNNSAIDQLLVISGLSIAGGTTGNTWRIMFTGNEVSSSMRVYAARLTMTMSKLSH